MNPDNGHIYDQTKVAEVKKDDPSLFRRLIQMEVEPTAKQMARIPPRVGRNEPCPCGSGKKFKKCHLTLEPTP